MSRCVQELSTHFIPASFDKKGQEAITKLFSHLQDAHNHMAQVAQAVVQLSKVSSPEQFTFVLQLAVRPICMIPVPVIVLYLYAISIVPSFTSRV